MRAKTKRKITTGLIIVVLVTVGYLAVAKWQGWWPMVKDQDRANNETIDSAKKLDADRAQADQKTPNQPAESNSTSGGSNTATDASSKQPDEQKPKYPRQLTITSQGSDADGNYELRVVANVVASSSAKCELIVNGKILETVGVQALPNSSACKGFLINKTNLQKGQNKFQVRFVSDNYTDVVEGEIKGE